VFDHKYDAGWILPLYKQIVDKPTVGWQAIGKVVQDVTYTRDAIPQWKLEDWGYKKHKVPQLERNYVSVDEFDRVRSILTRRGTDKYTSVALSLRGRAKSSRSQGWCMLSMVISRTREWTRVEVQYRTTEIILKFAADVWFVREICRRLEIHPSLYTFRFANCAISGAYFPYLCDKVDLIRFLARVYEADREFFIRTTRFLLKSSYRKDQYHPFSPEMLAHRFLWERASKQQITSIREYLEPLHRSTGRPLPKDFHDKSYVPKGQRKLTECDMEDE
jgi:hypothetical protein